MIPRSPQYYREIVAFPQPRIQPRAPGKPATIISKITKTSALLRRTDLISSRFLLFLSELYARQEFCYSFLHCVWTTINNFLKIFLIKMKINFLSRTRKFKLIVIGYGKKKKFLSLSLFFFISFKLDIYHHFVSNKIRVDNSFCLDNCRTSNFIP